MKQMTFADAEYAGKRKQTRKELFLIEMDRVVPWKGLIALIEPHYPKGEGGRPAYPLMAMLRVHLMQNWFGYSDPAMEEALYETTILRQFAGLNLERIPDETTILNFRRLLEKHELAAGILAVINGYLGDRGLSLRQGTIVDATLINAPSSTKNKDGKRDPEMHQTKKGNQYYFGMKAHIGADDESGLVHSVVGTAANVADVTQVDKLLHGDENMVGADAGYTGVEKRPEHEGRGSGTSQGRASVPGDQAPVRLCEGALPWSGEEHGATDDAVRSVEPVDGAPTFTDECRRGAPVMREMATGVGSGWRKRKKYSSN